MAYIKAWFMKSQRVTVQFQRVTTITNCIREFNYTHTHTHTHNTTHTHTRGEREKGRESRGGERNKERVRRQESVP